MYKKLDSVGANSKLFNNSNISSDSIGAVKPIVSLPASSSSASSSSSSASSSSASPSSTSSSELQAAAIFAQLKQKLSAELVKQVGCSYRFDVSNDKTKKSWLVDLKNGSGSISESDGKADCMVSIKDSDFVQLMSGKLNPQTAFMQGKLKVQGNMMLAQKLSLLMQPSTSSPTDPPKSTKPSQSSAPARLTSASSSTSGALNSSSIFAELSKRSDAELVKKIGCIYRFDISGDNGVKKSWVVDLKNGSGSVGESDSGANADCAISIKDGDFVLLMSGKLNPQQAFMQGKLKIQGNMMLAQKLSLLMSPKSTL